MRAWVWLLILLAALWGAWWAIATTQMQAAIAGLFEARRAAGWQISTSEPRRAGFPLLLKTRIAEAQFAGPKQERLDAQAMALSAPVWWPGDLSLVADDITVETRAGALPLDIMLSNVDADLSLAPGLALTLEAATGRSSGLRVDGPDGMLIDLAAPQVEIQRLPEQPTAYAIEVEAGRITPGPLLVRLLEQPVPNGAAPEAIARTVLIFDRPLDRHAASALTPPRLTEVKVDSLRLAWDEIALTAAGTLTFDAEGVPEGDLAIALTQWRPLVEAAQRAGVLPPTMRLQVETMLSALENRGEMPGGLDLTLGFADGQVALAGIPLGPAPRLPRNATQRQ